MDREQGDHRRTRRRFLRTAASVSAGVAAASVVGIVDNGTVGAVVEAAGSPAGDVAAILNLATLAETLALTLYYTALTGATFHIDEPAHASLALMMDTGTRHLQTLRSLGGISSRRYVYLPERLRADAGVFVRAALTVETASGGAYLAATGRLATLGQPQLAALAARHGASASQRLTLLGHLAGLAPADLTRAAPVFQRVSDATPELTPFLTGGAGFGEPVAVPTARQCRAARDTSHASYV